MPKMHENTDLYVGLTLGLIAVALFCWGFWVEFGKPARESRPVSRKPVRPVRLCVAVLGVRTDGESWEFCPSIANPQTDYCAEHAPIHSARASQERVIGLDMRL